MIPSPESPVVRLYNIGGLPLDLTEEFSYEIPSFDGEIDEKDGIDFNITLEITKQSIIDYSVFDRLNPLIVRFGYINKLSRPFTLFIKEQKVNFKADGISMILNLVDETTLAKSNRDQSDDKIDSLLNDLGANKDNPTKDSTSIDLSSPEKVLQNYQIALENLKAREANLSGDNYVLDIPLDWIDYNKFQSTYSYMGEPGVSNPYQYEINIINDVLSMIKNPDKKWWEFSRNRWFRTSDLGKVRGYLKDNIVIRIEPIEGSLLKQKNISINDISDFELLTYLKPKKMSFSDHFGFSLDGPSLGKFTDLYGLTNSDKDHSKWCAKLNAMGFTKNIRNTWYTPEGDIDWDIVEKSFKDIGEFWAAYALKYVKSDLNLTTYNNLVKELVEEEGNPILNDDGSGSGARVIKRDLDQVPIKSYYYNAEPGDVISVSIETDYSQATDIGEDVALNVDPETGSVITDQSFRINNPTDNMNSEDVQNYLKQLMEAKQHNVENPDDQVNMPNLIDLGISGWTGGNMLKYATEYPEKQYNQGTDNPLDDYSTSAVDETRVVMNIPMGLYNPGPISIDRAVNELQNMKRDQDLKKISAEMEIVGDPLIEVSQVINILNISNRFNGKYYIIKIKHKINTNSGYTTTIMAGKIPVIDAVSGITIKDDLKISDDKKAYWVKSDLIYGIRRIRLTPGVKFDMSKLNDFEIWDKQKYEYELADQFYNSFYNYHADIRLPNDKIPYEIKQNLPPNTPGTPYTKSPWWDLAQKYYNLELNRILNHNINIDLQKRFDSWNLLKNPKTYDDIIESGSLKSVEGNPVLNSRDTKEVTLTPASISAKIGLQMTEDDDMILYKSIADWVGTPYKLGGNTKMGIDCSNLVTKIYKEAYGYTFEGTAQMMFSSATPKPISQIQEGDLVFFGSGPTHIKHVGIYLKENKFINSTSTDGVRVSDLNNSYWKNSFYSVGKVL